MKKLLLSTSNPLFADDFINRNVKNLKDEEYFTTEKRFHKDYTEYRVYIYQVK